MRAMKATPDGHSKGTHVLIGSFAVLIGVTLGAGLVYFDSSSKSSLAVQAAGGMCPQGDYSCKEGGTSKSGQPCRGGHISSETVNGATCTCVCPKEGLVSVVCPSDGKCNGQKLEGKPKEMPKEMGGMPPMLPMLPMPMPKMPMPEPPKSDDCTQTPKPASCPPTVSNSLFDSLKNFFTGSTSSDASTTSTTAPMSMADRLKSFLGFPTDSGAAVANTGSTNNPTEAVVTPVTPSGSNAGQLTAQGTAQASSNGTTQGTGLTNQGVTGFGGGASADVNTSTGPIVSAIRDVIGKIRSLLSSWF